MSRLILLLRTAWWRFRNRHGLRNQGSLGKAGNMTSPPGKRPTFRP